MSESEGAEPWLVADDKPEDEGEGWPLRPLMLALIGLAAGFGTHLIIGGDYFPNPSVMQMTLLTALIVGAGLFGLTVERRHLPAALIFAAVCAAVASGIVWWNGNPDHWGAGDAWRMFSLVLALAIAAPLFQAARDAGGFSFAYPEVHDHAWTNIVLWFACWVFVAISWALAWLLASLFRLIDITFLEKLLQEEWFARCLIGLAFGAGLGLLREHGFVVRLLQRVVTTVLAVLAPVLATGLVLFLLALPFTGLAPLWKAWSATAILLACSMGALILANAVIGTAPEQARRFPLLRYGAMALGAVVLPLTVLAAVAIGLRIDQYGFTPDRLWALTFVVIASAFGVAYLVSLVRGRLDWAEQVRPANLNLAFGLCGVALLLATPLVSFNAISTRDQVARLESGRIKPDKFDWRALAFEFGESGKAALAKLQKSANATIRAKATEAAKAENRWDVPDNTETQAVVDLEKTLRILPAGTALPDELRTSIGREVQCNSGRNCTLFFMPGGKEAVLIPDFCFVTSSPQSANCMNPAVTRYVLNGDKWGYSTQNLGDDYEKMAAQATEQARRIEPAYKAGQIEIRPVTRRQVFVGDLPVGDPFE